MTLTRTILQIEKTVFTAQAHTKGGRDELRAKQG